MRKLPGLVGALVVSAALPVIAAGQNAAVKGNPLAKVERSADTLFKNADADKNGTLTQAELKKIEKPLAGKLREFTADAQIERAMFAEHALNADKAAPDLVGNEAVSPAEFKEFVLGTLSSHFAATRWQPAANAFPLGPANNAARAPRNNRRDDETAAERRARERQEDEDRDRNRQRQAQMQNAQRQYRAAQERDSFRPTPPPRERPSPGRESPPRSGGGRESGPKVGGPGNKR